MRTTDIVIRLHDSQDVPKLEIGQPQNYGTFYQELARAIQTQSADVVHKGDYFRHGQHLLPRDEAGYATFVLFRELTLEDIQAGDDAFWDILLAEVHRLDFPEIKEKEAHHQLIELSPAQVASDGSPEPEIAGLTEEILLRIPGSREELEFDPTGPEGNSILYDKLAKAIYDRDAEVMFKGPRLIFEENRDLFINADAFSVYVLFRAKRSSDYEDQAMLWSHLEADLKALSFITLLRSGATYQVLLFTHQQQIPQLPLNTIS